MNIEEQRIYLEQLRSRLMKDLYDKRAFLSGEELFDWKLIDSYSLTEEEFKEHFSTCDHVKSNGVRCGKRIKNIFIMKNKKTDEIQKVGSTCINNYIPIDDESMFDKLIGEIVLVNKVLSQVENKKINKYSKTKEKRVIRKAKEFGLIPKEIKMLMKHNVSLTKEQLHHLEKNVKKYENETRLSLKKGIVTENEMVDRRKKHIPLVLDGNYKTVKETFDDDLINEYIDITLAVFMKIDSGDLENRYVFGTKKEIVDTYNLLIYSLVESFKRMYSESKYISGLNPILVNRAVNEYKKSLIELVIKGKGLDISLDNSYKVSDLFISKSIEWSFNLGKQIMKGSDNVEMIGKGEFEKNLSESDKIMLSNLLDKI